MTENNTVQEFKEFCEHLELTVNSYSSDLNDNKIFDNSEIKNIILIINEMKDYREKIAATKDEQSEIDELFNWVETEPTLQRKAELVLAQYKNTYTEKELYLSMATSVFLESFLFYSGFFYPLYLAGQGKMVASGEIISLILRDESLHGKYIGLLAQELYQKF